MLVPPWEKSSDGPTSLRWRMGGGDTDMDEWLGLSSDERRTYLQAHPPTEEWKRWLSLVTLGGPVPKPRRPKYPS